MKNMWFITGTDTNIGKTIVSTILLQKASQIGYNTAGYKPIAAGCVEKKHGLFNSDVLLLKKYSSVYLKYKEINLFSLKDFLPPNFFFEKNKKINLYQISQGLKNLQKKSNWIIIEGIGGWYTPIFHTTNFAKWILIEKIPVILVIGIKLGCINHAILTYQAIIKDKIKCSGWITNCCVNQEEKYLKYYIKTIKKYIMAPYLGNLPYFQNIKNIFSKKNSITLPK
ncbi:dethiobiotin synthase [Buchnera aphidicola]|uniref:dethiobiotin synthase n=1 Tax=Buchnera aphidicola TaxID=9 RepID=UPI003464B5C8